MGIENLQHIQRRLDKEKGRLPARRQIEKPRGLEKKPKAIEARTATVGKKIEKKKSSKLVTAVAGAALLYDGAVGGSVLFDYLNKSEPLASIDTPAALLKLATDMDRLPVEQFTAEKRQLPDKLILTVALLAHAAEPKYADFDKDPALADANRVSEGLVLPLVHRKNVDATFWEKLSREFNSADPNTADIRLDLLKDLSAKYGGVEPIELEESAAYVARNLYFKDQKPTAEAVRAEVRSILDRRQTLAGENVFDRDMMLVSADELWREGLSKAPRFGNQNLSNALQARLHMSGNATATFSHVTPLFHDASGYHSNAETIANAKDTVLEKIASSEKPLTVYFDGHGGYGSFYLSESLDRTEDETINFHELADALTRNWRSAVTRDPKAKELPVTLIFDDCMMQTFVRSLSTELEMHNIPLPHAMVTASEWEQYSFSNNGFAVGSAFGDLMTKSPNLGALMEQKHSVESSDPSVFAPRKEDPKKLMQVSGIVVPSSVA